MAKLAIETSLRPCHIATHVPRKEWPYFDRVFDTPGLFHMFATISDCIEPSLMKGGHPGGIISRVVAIVELNDGRVVYANTEDVRFCDDKHREYCFKEVTTDG